jgi:hypothetical protein
VPLRALCAVNPFERPEFVREPSGLSVVPSEESMKEAGPRTVLFAPTVMAALREGLAHPVGGEVVVRSGDVIGRIYLYKGAIAWVNCSGLQVRLRDTLLANAGLRAEELDAALQESQQLRQHFAETLLAWGLVDREQLWECLRIHTARHLRAVAELQEDPQVLFVPLVRTYSAGLVFTLEQLLEGDTPREPEEAEPRETATAPRPSLATVGGCAPGHLEAGQASAAQRLAALLPSTMLAAALFDTEARHVCGHLLRLKELGKGLEELSQWLMGLVEPRGESSSQPREVLIVAEETIHVLSRSELCPSLYLWVMCDASFGVGRALAHCRMAIKSLVQELSCGRPGPAEPRGGGA